MTTRLLSMASRRLLGGCVAGLMALAGCASYGPGALPPGSTQDQAIATMGAPTGRYPLQGGGERLEFARGPFGKHTYMLDYDENRRLVRTEQVLTERNFLDLRIGMTRDEVLRRIGHPSEVSYLTRQQHQLWSYRYDTPFCIWYQVSLDNANRVAELGNNVDPMCERGDDRVSFRRR